MRNVCVHDACETKRGCELVPRQDVTLEDRVNYFAIGNKPLTKVSEDDMETISALVTSEHYLDHWDAGCYECARCQQPLYSSADKWNGPCRWPSWRRPIAEAATTLVPVDGYNGYECRVLEVYCSGCELFLGHQFEDAVAKGDTSPGAQWRH